MTNPASRRPAKARFSPGRIGIYSFLFFSALFFALPLFVMLITSFKTMEEIRTGSIFSLPRAPELSAWIKAWSSACTGMTCDGIQVGFWNSVRILIPATVISIFVGALNGYALAMWKVRWAGLAFLLLMTGAFIPYQVYVFPLVQLFALSGTFGSLFAIVTVHIIFGMPVMTLIFRNYFSSIPEEVFKAARMDGAGFWWIFFAIMLPMATPVLIVAVIWQVTGIWNDFLLGLIFAGRDNLPMTVQLNNIVNSQFGEREYNVDMAATMLTALVPLVLYFVSGRWFVRGIAAGSVKG
ncbi:carbohydrate ABC transporter permease [Natronohydrobacter thiooxidans]|uniref:carbohydrate ABC transporter permease n=1 Tax=Natronohydrobacter thiooxidans TaxID=87172 RepID=UPI0008FF2FB3|nr:carbohydrate ABC transporter permease [Natronohydrobacter thiooxidans]